MIRRTMTRTRQQRRRIWTAAAVAGVLAALAPGAPTQAAPQELTQQAPHPQRQGAGGDGLTFASTTTYVVDPSGVVKALAEVTVTNVLPDITEGFTITRRYFTGFFLPVPVGATNFVGTSNGRGVAVTTELVEGNTDYFLADVSLPSRLFYRQTVTVNVAYDITGFPPRSENPSRVNAAFSSFHAYGIGDPGKVTIKVVVPAGYTVETFGDEFVVTEEFGHTVYTATNIQNPDDFDMFIAARKDDALAATAYVDAAGRSFLIRAWPGDTEWVEFVQTQIDEGLPVLEEAIGQDWPIEELLVREAYSPYFYGYAGWFSAVDEEIEMGEELDQETILHELSHAWFNNEWFHERWVSEGLAQVYSNRVVEELDGDVFDPAKPTGSHPGKQQLNEWGNLGIEDNTEVEEDYGYSASYWLAWMLAENAGDDGMRAVFDAVANGDIAYQGEVEPEDAVETDTDWQRLLDLLQEVGGADDEIIELFEQYVIVPGDADLLDERATARTAYDELEASSDEWAAPVGVRRAMSKWFFDDATEMMTVAGEVLELRDELDALSAQLGVTYPSTFETEYEAAGEDELAEVAADLQTQIDAAELVLAAVTAEAADDSLLERIGLLGTDLPGDLEDAKAALSSGDLATSDAAAQDVIDTVDEAGDVGTSRALTAGGILLGFIVLVVLLLWWRHRRKRRKARAAASAAEAAAADELVGEPTEAVEGGELEPDRDLFAEPAMGDGGEAEPEDAPLVASATAVDDDDLDMADVGDGHHPGSAPAATDDGETVGAESDGTAAQTEHDEGLQPDPG